MAENKPSISLTINLADGATKVVEFNSGDPIMVGSGASAHVRIEGDDVSSLHCMIKPKDGKIAVLDLGSDEGTELNGKELKGETDVSDGDVITVGKAKISVHFGGDILAPTVPIRRATGHEAANPEITAPLADAPPLMEKLREDRDTAELPPKPMAASKKSEPTEVVREKKNGASAHAVPSSKDAERTAPSKPAAPPSGATASSGNGAPKRTATSMPPRVVQRETSKSGFKLGKVAANAHRKIAETHGKAAKLGVMLSAEEQPVGKGHVDVTMLWGGTVIGVARTGGGVVTIGQASENSFNVAHPSIPSPSFVLVNVTATGAVVNIAPEMKASVDGRQVSGQATLEVGEKCVIVVGPVEFHVQYTKRHVPLPITSDFDTNWAKVLALALIAQLGLVLAFFVTAQLPSLDDDDLFKNQQEFTKLILTAQEKKKEKKELSGKKAAQHKDDAGVFGKKDKPKEDKLASKKGAPTVDKDKREEDRKIAMDALAQLGLKGPEGAVSNVFGPGGLGSGINNALGGMHGASMGDAGGAGGLGSRGTGAGGGGNGLGIGGLGSGTGRGSGGNGNIDLGGRGKGMTRIVPGKIIYEGGLSREEIQRVISRVMSQIKYCYEKELNKDPNLEGKLVASWVIAGTGDVASSQMAQNTFSGASAQPVEQCVLRIIARLKFPQPKGGGQVFVTYPFVFSSSGGG
jgi:hypothetical protein